MVGEHQLFVRNASTCTSLAVSRGGRGEAGCAPAGSGEHSGLLSHDVPPAGPERRSSHRVQGNGDCKGVDVADIFPFESNARHSNDGDPSQ